MTLIVCFDLLDFGFICWGKNYNLPTSMLLHNPKVGVSHSYLWVNLFSNRFALSLIQSFLQRQCIWAKHSSVVHHTYPMFIVTISLLTLNSMCLPGSSRCKLLLYTSKIQASTANPRNRWVELIQSMISSMACNGKVECRGWHWEEDPKE